MNEIVSAPAVSRNDEKCRTKIQPVSLNWKDNLSVQRLLDVVVSIMAEEYIRIAKENPGVFSEIASGTSCPRNDEEV